MDHQYFSVVKNILDNGTWQENRTGEDTITFPGQMMRMNLQAGFPAVTTKKLAFKTAMGELAAFIRGADSAAEFRQLGCKVWDANANKNQAWLANPFRTGEDDLGGVYGVQWRRWPAFKRFNQYEINDAMVQQLVKTGWDCIGDTQEPTGDTYGIWYKEVDQLGECVQKIIVNPADRRIIFHAWNVAELDAMALPPCHLLYHFHPNIQAKELSMSLYIR